MPERGGAEALVRCGGGAEALVTAQRRKSTPAPPAHAPAHGHLAGQPQEVQLHYPLGGESRGSRRGSRVGACP